MKKILCAGLVLLAGTMLPQVALAADTADRETIQKQVDEVVAAINSGKKAEDFEDLANLEPYYVFISKQDGRLLVHPWSDYIPHRDVLEAIRKATIEGLWVSYFLEGRKKHAYVRKTDSGLIVGSGFWD